MNLRTHLTLRVTERTSGEMTIKSETDKGETFRASGPTAGFVFWGGLPSKCQYCSKYEHAEWHLSNRQTKSCQASFTQILTS